MKWKNANIFLVLIIFLMGGFAHSAPKLLLSDKSLSLEKQLEQLYQKPAEDFLFPDSPEREEFFLEPVPVALARTLALKELSHPRVQFYLDYFTGPARNHFQLYLERSALYQDYIQSALKENGLPESLFYLAMIESGLNPYAKSRAGAGGIWQFMPSTARRFGLRVDFWVDERRDLEKSTRSAIAYLKELYQRFGSWPLALASYNAGEGKVAWVMEKNDSDDYWELIELPGLKQETRDYLPKMIAACIIAENPEEYGFYKPEKKPAPQWEKLLVKDAVDLYKVAEVAGVSAEEIQKLNLALLRGITPPGSQYELNIPPGTGEKLLSAYQSLKPEERISYAHHRVKKGDTLSKIAQKYGVSVDELRRVNHLSKISQIRVGQSLIIPISAGKAGTIIAYSKTNSPKPVSEKKAVKYRVKPGDTLYAIARNHQVKVEDIKRWNNIKNDTIRVNQELVLYLPSSSQPKSSTVAKASPKKPGPKKTTSKNQTSSPKANSEKIYQVQPGDTLWKISQIYNVEPEDLMQWNNLSSSKIKPGDTIVIRAD